MEGQNIDLLKGKSRLILLCKAFSQFPAVGKKQKHNLAVQLRVFKCGETQRSSMTAHIIKVVLIYSAPVAAV